MRHTSVVAYDVCDPKRLRKAFRTMRGHGDHLQLSVFRCELSDREMIELRAALTKIIDAALDQVLFVSIGPADGRAATAFATLGRPQTAPERVAVIV